MIYVYNMLKIKNSVQLYNTYNHFRKDLLINVKKVMKSKNNILNLAFCEIANK